MGRRVGRIVLAVAVALLLFLLLGRRMVGFYTDILWYDDLDYLSTFWTRFRMEIGVRAAAAAVGAALVFVNLWWVARHLGPVRVRRRYGNIEIAERIPRKYVLGVITLVAVLGGWWLAELQFSDASVLAVMSWIRHVPWGVADPVYGRDIAFYVFGLPVAVSVLGFLILATAWVLALVGLGHVLVGGIQWGDSRVAITDPARLHLGVLVAALLVLLGVRFWLARYGLLVDGTGVGGSLGFTDVEARIPALWILLVLALAAAAGVVYGAWKNALVPPVAGIGVLLLAGVLLTTAYPTVVQKFQVEPNELSREAPFIRWHMEFTKRSYGLAEMERRRFPYRRSTTADDDQLRPILASLPLWDTAPLRQTFNEVQALFQYYWFPDVDFDRYGPPGRERQVGIGVREFQPEGLDTGARTWQSLHLNPAYIRGLGAVVADARADPRGSRLPTLWTRNIHPLETDADAPPSVRLDRPSVFFAEAMTDYAIVIPGRDGEFTGEPGIDFPRGVPLNSFARVLAFSWRFGDETLLFSGDVSRDSRMLFRRSVRSRLDELAPFILWDTDPLPVIHNGAIVWLVDGYTTSSSYPLSRSLAMGRASVRYLRNSVKATVDGITGEVALYALGDDPILATHRRVFPELVRPLDEMPAPLRRHLRYPELAIRARTEILQEYHLERVEDFYAGQDVWQRPRQATPNGGVQDYRPLYALMPLSDDGGTAFLGVTPFIARGRRNMTAILMAHNDQDNYGRLTLLELPRDEQVPGPDQVQAVIEQDAVISMELSLLRQRGSGVDMGHLRVIPLDSTILYIQPLFLSAAENPIPELWRIVASDGRNVRMAPTLAAALAALTGVGDGEETAAPEMTVPATAGWPREALELLDRAEERLRAGDWAAYGNALESLRTLLEQLDRTGGEVEPRP